MKLNKPKMAQGRGVAYASGLLVLLGAQSVAAQDLRFWTTEVQPDRLAKQEAMAADFEAETGISVSIIPVNESDLGTRVTAAFAASDLPDVIYHPLQYALPWLEAGILDAGAATNVIDELGLDTFSVGALAMGETDDEYAAVPVDGWTQFLVYRKDLFDAAGLDAPDSYGDIVAAMEALHNPPELYGFVPHIKVDDASMSQQLEYIFLANGLSPVDENGIVPFDEATTIETLEFVKSLAENAPEGDLYWQQSRDLYFAGRTAMIMWSPFLLDELAGLRDSAPPTFNDDPTTRDLAAASAFVTTISGPSNDAGAAWADVRFFGITVDADADAAAEFVRFSMSDGYMQTLSIAPEGKFPLRLGTADAPTAFVDAWSKLDVGVDRRAPLSELYPQEQIDVLVAGLSDGQRWGNSEGQLAMASKILNSQFINRIVREFIDGDLDGPEAVAALNAALAEFE